MESSNSNFCVFEKKSYQFKDIKELHCKLLNILSLIYEPIKLFKLAGELFKDIKLCYEFDERLNFWCEEFEYKWRDISLGVMGGMHLKDCDYF